MRRAQRRLAITCAKRSFCGAVMSVARRSRGSFGSSAIADTRPPITAGPIARAFSPARSEPAIAGGAVGRLRGSAGRWVPGMTMDWTPVVPELVAEVGYDQADSGRFRHPTRFRRWRPDRDPASCTFAQLP